MAETIGSPSAKAEKEPGKLKRFGQTVLDLLVILSEARKEELVHGHAITDRFPAKEKLDPEKLNRIH